MAIKTETTVHIPITSINNVDVANGVVTLVETKLIEHQSIWVKDKLHYIVDDSPNQHIQLTIEIVGPSGDNLIKRLLEKS